ncbi:actin-binding Rho-activating protein-like isoform X2 [Phymastichus coffea]|nr:actin-binding Rho-activating protein-like isoform X2 [Phymastichus coffea]
MFDQHANKHINSQSKNPFSSGLNLPKPTFSKEEYGRPAAGSMSDIRGRKANAHILKEILELCEVLDQNGTPCRDHPEILAISFGDLFNLYVHINDKLVGLLLRARKQKLVDFEGECLFQRRDDHVPIFLLKPIKEIREDFRQRLDALHKEIPKSPS